MIRNNRSISLPFIKYSSLLLMIAVFAVSLQADDWPNFRGPNHDGISKETGWKATAESKVLWKAEIGLGYSVPVVSGGKVIVSGHDGVETDTIFCFDEANGNELWKFSYPQPLGDLYFAGGTTSSATFDGEQVFCLAREGELFCLEASSGKVKWQIHLQRDFGYKKPKWGFTGAPLVQAGRLYITAGDSGLALNKSDGSAIWKSKDEEAGYSMPYPFSRDEKDLLIFTNKSAYVCVDAESGKEIWRVKWMTRYGVNAAPPIISGDFIFISSGYGKGATLLEWKGDGDPKKVWKSRDMRNQMNGCVLIGGFLYGIDGNESVDGRGLKCLDLKSGETKWTDTKVGVGAISAVGSKLLVLTEKGELQIGAASPSGWKSEMSRQVFGPKTWTVPVLANGKIFCRNSEGKLVVISVKAN